MIGIAGVRRTVLRSMCVALLVSPAASQERSAVPHPDESFSGWGRSTHTVLVRSDVGVWDGTWVYISRDERVVLWFKTESGIPSVKLRYMSNNSGEGFETDWNGVAEYELREADGSFSLGITQRDANLIEGRWDWTLSTDKSSRVEIGEYQMYRSGDGRIMALNFDNLVRTLFKGGNTDRVRKGPQAWNFRKASKRLALWDELPF